MKIEREKTKPRMILAINDQEYFIIHKARHKINAIKKDNSVHDLN